MPSSGEAYLCGDPVIHATSYLCGEENKQVEACYGQSVAKMRPAESTSLAMSESLASGEQRAGRWEAVFKKFWIWEASQEFCAAEDLNASSGKRIIYNKGLEFFVSKLTKELRAIWRDGLHSRKAVTSM